MRVIVLTKSDKNGGFCVAGIDVETGNFVRLVSNNSFSHYAIPQHYMQNIDVLDVIDVSVNRCVPSFCQQENVEVRLEQWQKICSISTDDLKQLVNNDLPFIFVDDCFYLEETDAQKLSYSLMMVQVSNLSITRNQYNKTKARFYYNGTWYSNMSITDPQFYNFEGFIGNAILVISIPDVGHTSEYYSESRCYKFVSKIFAI